LLQAFFLATSGGLAGPTGTTSQFNATHTFNTYAPQISPSFPNLKVSLEAKPYYNNGSLNTRITLSKVTLNMKSYPEAWDVPDVNRKEVQAIIKQTNWNYVPKTSVRKFKNDDLVQQGYDERKDPGCWWSAINCVKPKVNYLPQGYYTCPKGEWGLTYDDGPFNLRDSDGKDAKLKIHMLSLDCIITWPRRILRELYL
jgi:hypothetical protein